VTKTFEEIKFYVDIVIFAFSYYDIITGVSCGPNNVNRTTYDGSMKVRHLRRENAAASATVIELKSVGNLSLYFNYNAKFEILICYFEFHTGTKNVQFVEDHPMNIHVQFGFNHICSF
jgi:hypothetical protein